MASTTAAPGVVATRPVSASPVVGEGLYGISNLYDAESLLTAAERQVLALTR